MGKAIFVLVFVDDTDSKGSSPALGTVPAEAEIGAKLSPTPVADAHDLQIGFAVFSSLGLNKDQSLQAFCASSASTSFKDVFEWMKIISSYVACKTGAKDAQILPKRAETELSLLICFCHMQ